ncbi:MAG: hypothetical protein Q9188_007176, partial [Gyalolechia gomerana]
ELDQRLKWHQTYPEADAQDPVAGRGHFQRLHIARKEFVFASGQAMLHFSYTNSWAKAGERNDAIGSDFVTPRNLFRKQAKDKVSDYVSLHGKRISSQLRSPVHWNANQIYWDGKRLENEFQRLPIGTAVFLDGRQYRATKKERANRRTD